MKKQEPTTDLPATGSAAVAEALEREILAGCIKPGEQLPTEAALGARFKTSRTVIREAVKRLNANGLVRTRRGSGSYVAELDAGQAGESLRRFALLAHDIGAYEKLMEARLCIETFCARHLAERGTSQQLASVKAAVDGMRASVLDLRKFGEHDVAFHVAIVHGVGNDLLTALHSAMQGVMLHFTAATYRLLVDLTVKYKDHEAIYNAIEAGDGMLAEALMRAHILGAKSHTQRVLASEIAPPGAEPRTPPTTAKKAK